MSGARSLAPSKLGEQAYQAQRARRYPRVNGIPDPRATFAPAGTDRDDLSRYARFAFDAYLDEQVPPAWFAQVGPILLADIDRRYPPADMEVLARHRLTARVQSFVVDVRDAPNARFEMLGEWRDLPPNRFGHEASRFTSIEAHASERVALVPAETMPLFDALTAAHARKGRISTT